MNMLIERKIIFKKSFFFILLGFILGIGFSAYFVGGIKPLLNLIQGSDNHLGSDHDWVNASAKNKANDEPLYWVAPMDDNYRRKEPGLSPMGMDLVPVFANKNTGVDEGPGTIYIAPHVVNNLGVRTAPVRFESLHKTIHTVGNVVYDQQKITHVNPVTQGWIDKVYVKTIGDRVVKNQPLYRLYSPELVNAQEEFLLALNSNNRYQINAAKKRLLALQIPKKTIEELQKSQKVQQNITFYASQNGVVTNLNIRTGSFVTPKLLMMSITDLSSVWIESHIFERQTQQVHIGMLATIDVNASPGKKWLGKVDYIYPIMDEKMRTLKVRLILDNMDEILKVNMFTNITFHSDEQEKTMVIPTEALIRTGKQDRVVLSLGQGSYKSVEVSVGQFGETSVEILDGLSVADRVVSSGQFLLDSESSKSSDFKRMMVGDSTDELATSQDDNSQATTQGIVNAVMAEQRMVNITRAAIDKWQRPIATVDFRVADHITLSKFVTNAFVEFVFEVNDNEFLITQVLTEKDLMKVSGNVKHELKLKLKQEMEH
jgi:Cu(I)/Ag(I) efflux system membrane fusion protein